MGLGDKVRHGVEDLKHNAAKAEDDARIAAGDAKTRAKVKTRRFGSNENQTAAIIGVVSALAAAGLGGLGYWLWKKKKENDDKKPKQPKPAST
jgi:uncharacterized membrane protein YebE (DUF533 family)